MKRILLSLFATFVFYGLMLGLTKYSSAIETPVTPPTPPSPTGVEGLATGGVWATKGGTTLKLNFNAHSGNPTKGNVMYSDSTGMSFRGKVDQCYYQTGNTAVFAGTIEKGSSADSYFWVEVQDNGEGRKAASPDMLEVHTTDVAPTCSPVATLSATVTKGNLQVH